MSWTHWYPFELDHGLPSDGSLLKMNHYKQKLGEIRVKQMSSQMTETGKREKKKKQNDLINILFRAYFEQEGISGVPHFRINDKIELSGAQDPQEFIQAFRKAGINV